MILHNKKFEEFIKKVKEKIRGKIDFKGEYMGENQEYLACAWCDGEIKRGDKAYKRTGYFGLYCSLPCLVKGARMKYEEIIVNDDVIKREFGE